MPIGLKHNAWHKGDALEIGSLSYRHERERENMCHSAKRCRNAPLCMVAYPKDKKLVVGYGDTYL